MYVFSPVVYGYWDAGYFWTRALFSLAIETFSKQ
jgi:hypothetical protein